MSTPELWPPVCWSGSTGDNLHVGNRRLSLPFCLEEMQEVLRDDCRKRNGAFNLHGLQSYRIIPEERQQGGRELSRGHWLALRGRRPSGGGDKQGHMPVVLAKAAVLCSREAAYRFVVHTDVVDHDDIGCGRVR